MEKSLFVAYACGLSDVSFDTLVTMHVTTIRIRGLESYNSDV